MKSRDVLHQFKIPQKLIPFGLLSREKYNSVSHSDTMRFDFIIHVGGDKNWNPTTVYRGVRTRGRNWIPVNRFSVN